MARVALLCFLAYKYVFAQIQDNSTVMPVMRQLLDFKLKHPRPIGLHTVGSGAAVEIRELITLNSDLFRNDLFFDSQFHMDGERVPQRVVHAKGFAVWGYFEVTNDVSNYTKADVFNGIGKKTPVLARFSDGAIERGASDVARELKGMVLKFYTKDGNLDFLNLQFPVFATKDPIDFPPLVHGIQRNPRTSIFDLTELLDSISLRPDGLLTSFYVLSDYGIPNGWRHMDSFPIHTYELNNNNRDRYYVKFSFRTEQGMKNLTTLEAAAIQSVDLNYYIRDMYNAISNQNYPSWRLEMDVLSLSDVKKIDYDPFDPTTVWKKGTYKTVTIGRLKFNRLSDNQFRDQEQAAFSPANLIPGIPGPVDTLFRGRRFAYRDTQNYRVGRNHLRVGVNAPLYHKSYVRDGSPPVGDNGNDAPNYFPNSFNGPLPYVDDERPKEQLMLLQSNAVDLQPAADFYNEVVRDEGARQRFINNIVLGLLITTDPPRERTFRLLRLIDENLYIRVVTEYDLAVVVRDAALAAASTSSNLPGAGAGVPGGASNNNNSVATTSNSSPSDGT